jgi:hypothetical protein
MDQAVRSMDVAYYVVSPAGKGRLAKPVFGLLVRSESGFSCGAVQEASQLDS